MFAATLIADKLFARTGSASQRSRDLFGNTPLHSAVCRGSSESVQALLCQGADVDARDDAGATPLHQAVVSGDLGLASMLIRRGADINAVTDHGVTPLQLARMFGRFSDPAWRALMA